MKKKLAVIIMAFIMMISGCSMALSQGEYYNRFSENYKAYNKNLLSLSAKLGARDSLDAIEKLSPPPIYSAQHRNICEDIQSEREWCEAVAKVAEDRELTDDMLQEITDAAYSSQFHTSVFNLIMQMKKDGVSTN